jgi:hypothetical protein
MMSESLDRAQVSRGGEVDGEHAALGLADGGEEVLGGEGAADLGGAEVERGHALGLEPDAHGEHAAAEDVGFLHAGHGRELRLHDARQVVRDLVGLHRLAVKPT